MMHEMNDMSQTTLFSTYVASFISSFDNFMNTYRDDNLSVKKKPDNLLGKKKKTCNEMLLAVVQRITESLKVTREASKIIVDSKVMIRGAVGDCNPNPSHNRNCNR